MNYYENRKHYFKPKIKVISFLNSFTGASGGDTRFVEIMKCLQKKNSVNLTVVTSNMGRIFCKERGLNGIFKITTHENAVTNKADTIILLFIKRILSSLRLNLKVDTHTILYSAYQFLPDVLPVYVLKRRKNVRWVQTLYHLVPPPTQRDGPFIRNLFAFIEQKTSFALIRRYADVIFVLNTIVKNQLVQIGFSKERIYVIGAGVDLSKIDQIKSHGILYDACFLGRLHPSKGVFDLPEIWKLVVSRKKNAKLAIVYIGSKNVESALTKIIKEENLESNIVMLPITGKAALGVVKSSRIFVFPSHEEGWGIAISEAMACKLPVVAFNLPVYAEIFGQDIITVPLRDFSSFSTKIVDLLEDENGRKVLGQRGRNRMAAFDWKMIADKELSIICASLN